MSVALIVVTHGGIGRELVEAARVIMGDLPLPTAMIGVGQDSTLNDATDSIRAEIERLESDAGTLVLCDLIGATPSNAACHAVTGRHARVIAGLNLPMLLRAYNYPSAPLETLAARCSDSAVAPIAGHGC